MTLEGFHRTCVRGGHYPARRMEGFGAEKRQTTKGGSMNGESWLTRNIPNPCAKTLEPIDSLSHRQSTPPPPPPRQNKTKKSETVLSRHRHAPVVASLPFAPKSQEIGTDYPPDLSRGSARAVSRSPPAPAHRFVVSKSRHGSVGRTWPA